MLDLLGLADITMDRDGSARRAAIWLTVSARPSSLTSAQAISAPCRASPMAMACPKPLAAPVTTATRPDKSNRLSGIGFISLDQEPLVAAANLDAFTDSEQLHLAGSAQALVGAGE